MMNFFLSIHTFVLKKPTIFSIKYAFHSANTLIYPEVHQRSSNLLFIIITRYCEEDALDRNFKPF